MKLGIKLRQNALELSIAGLNTRQGVSHAAVAPIAKRFGLNVDTLISANGIASPGSGHMPAICRP